MVRRRLLISLHAPALVIAAILNGEQQQQQQQHRQHDYDGASLGIGLSDFSLRFAADWSLAHAFPIKRDGNCGDGKHNCLDIQHPDRCCENDSYCYISKDNQPKCCPIGSDCVNDSYCSSQAFYCTSTQTVSATVQSPVAGCCDRACPQTSYYLCPQSLGGNCCPFGSDCQVGGNCVSTKTTEETPRVTPSVEICTKGQVVCPGGSGCCDSNKSNGPPSASAVPTDDANSNGDGSSPAGDSRGSGPSGTTIGLAVGLSLGGAFIIGCLAWLFLLKRKHDLQAQELENHQEDQQKHEHPNCDPSMTTSSPSAHGLWGPPPDTQAPTPSTPLYPIIHEPNGVGAPPAEIDSVERVEAANTERDRPSPRSFQVSDLDSPTENGLSPGRAAMTSWLQLSPISPTSPDDL